MLLVYVGNNNTFGGRTETCSPTQHLIVLNRANHAAIPTNENQTKLPVIPARGLPLLLQKLRPSAATEPGLCIEV